MKSPPAELQLQPAPRPRERLTDDDLQSIVQAASASGFGRPSHPLRPDRRTDAGATPTPPVPPVRRGETRNPAAGRQDDALLKLKAPAALALALKHEALRRRVTVRFLVLEALAQAGYGFDFENIPEDGRRVR